MVNPQKAQKVLSEHFRRITLDEFEARHDKYVESGQAALSTIAETPEDTPIILYQREAERLSLNAYFTSALTGLDGRQRKHVDTVSGIVDLVCKDLDVDLYQPGKVTDPISHPDVSAEDVFNCNMDRERVLSSDLLVLVADNASTGAGEELDIAQAALIPIVLLTHGETKVSRMVTGIPTLKLMITYSDLDELRNELMTRLTEIRPILEQRKLAFSDFNKNMIGNKVRVTRQEAGLTKQDVAASSNDLLTVERIRFIEGNPDSVSNPSLTELRTIATVLKTTVADLVEPDLGERMITLLREWMLKGVAPRSTMSERDQLASLRKTLYRVLDSTENCGEC